MKMRILQMGKLGHKRLNLPRIMDLVSDGAKFEPR